MRGGAGDGRRKGWRQKGMQESHRRLRSETVHLPEHEGKWRPPSSFRFAESGSRCVECSRGAPCDRWCVRRTFAFSVMVSRGSPSHPPPLEMFAKYKRQNVEHKADIPIVSQHWVDS